MNIHRTQILLRATISTLILITLPTIANAEAESWYLKPYIGLSQMSDITGSFTEIEDLSGQADINLDAGFVSGLGVGYQYTEQFAVELAWEYRTNGSSSELLDSDLMSTATFSEGNYASNIFFLNGFYLFAQSGNWQPYVGAGISWIQEVDIDLEEGGASEELSYSGSGQIGYQVFAGANYQLNEKWSLNTELRYGSTTGIDLTAEQPALGDISGLDYKPLTLQLGAIYEF